MRRLLASSTVSVRSWLALLLDRTGDLCTRVGGWCFSARARLLPAPSDLTPEAAHRILVHVMAQIADPPFRPTSADVVAANVADRHSVAVYKAATPAGDVLYTSRQQGQA